MKKAQGQIVTTILIILLVLAAIVIVWQVVGKSVEEGLKLEFKITKESRNDISGANMLVCGEKKLYFTNVTGYSEAMIEVYEVKMARDVSCNENGGCGGALDIIPKEDLSIEWLDENCESKIYNGLGVCETGGFCYDYICGDYYVEILE